MESALKWSLTAAIIVYVSHTLSCAARGRPGGGPIDKIPPEIIYTFPQTDSVNIADLKRIEINFSERMDEGSVTKSLFLSPPIEYQLEWAGGDEMTMELQKSLEPNRTYLITIGSGAMDAHNNRLRDSYQLAFSTGRYLDRGQISGQIYGITPKDVFFIYAYQIDHPDSLDPTINRANYLSQPSADGNFNMKYLPEGRYRIFVVEDQNRNLVLDAGYERIGIPFRDVLLDSVHLEAEDLNFKITKIDTVKPMMTGARSLNNRKILLRFSEPVLRPEKTSIIDTLTLEKLDIFASETNPENVSQRYLYTATQDSGRGYRILCSDLSDTSGNIMYGTQSVSFIGSELADTTHFALLGITPGDSARNIRYPATVNLKFSLPLDTLSLQESFLCFDDAGDTLSGIWKFNSLSDVLFDPVKKFLPGKQYRITSRAGNIRSVFQDTLEDTLINHTFFMISQDEFGSLSGSSNLEGELVEIGYIDIFPVPRRAGNLRIKLRGDNSYHAEWLAEGEYQIGGFLDLDKNGKYSYGTIFPFSYAEPVFINQDTIKIRKRWESAGIDVNYPGIK